MIYVAQPYGGMDPAQMEGLLTNYYEYQFLYISGIHHVESRNIQGASLMRLIFHPGTDMAHAMAETIAYVNRARAFMPPGTVPPFVMRFDTGSVPVGARRPVGRRGHVVYHEHDAQPSVVHWRDHGDRRGHGEWKSIGQFQPGSPEGRTSGGSRGLRRSHKPSAGNLDDKLCDDRRHGADGARRGRKRSANGSLGTCRDWRAGSRDLGESIRDAGDLRARAAQLGGSLHVDMGDNERGPRYSTDGKRIEPGQLLLEISVPELADELRQKQAAARQAEAALQQARSQVRVAAADEQRVTTLLECTKVRAPFDGVISERNTNLGHFVPAGGKPVFMLVQADVVRVFVDVPELDAALVDVSDRAVVRVEALGHREFQGNVTRMSWTLSNTARTLHTEVDLPNPSGELRPGMYVNVTIVLAERQNAVTLPNEAIVSEAGQAFCWLVANGTAHKTPLKLGLKTASETEVLEGLLGGESVITGGVATLQPDQPVQIATPAKP